jgi:DNA replication protein DnaC
MKQLPLPKDYEVRSKAIINRINSDLKDNNPMYYWFCGNVGTGKSYLANLIMEHIKQQLEANLVKYKNRNEELLNEQSNTDDEEKRAEIRQARDKGTSYISKAECSLKSLTMKAQSKFYAEYLSSLSDTGEKLGKIPAVIDDLGLEKNTEAGIKFSADIIEREYDLFIAGKKRVLFIITTNLNEKQIRSRYGDHVYSRMCEIGVFFEFTGQDFRLNKKEVVR